MNNRRLKRKALLSTWVVQTTVMPLRARLWSSTIRRSSVAGSRPDEGSSRNRTEGLDRSSMPMLTRLRWPPESWLMRLFLMLVEPELVDDAIDAGADERQRQIDAQAAAEQERVADPELLVDDVVLRHVTDAELAHAGLVGQRLAADHHLALGRGDQAAERVEQGGLALAGAAEDADELAGTDLDADLIEDRAVSGAAC